MPRKVTRERQWTEWVETCTVCGTDFVTNNPTDRLVDHSTVCCDCQRAKGEATERERQKTRIGGAVVIDTCVRHTYGDHAELKGILIRNGDGMLLEIIAEPDYDGGADLVIREPEYEYPDPNGGSSA